MQNLTKSFFEQDIALAEIEIPQDQKSKFIKWSKRIEKSERIQEKLKATLEMKDNEYYLRIDDDDVPLIMNISELTRPMNKINLLIPAPPYADPLELKNIHSINYKAKAKFEDNSKEYELLNRKMRKLSHSDSDQKHRIFSSDQSEEIEVTESDSDSDFQEPQQIALSHKDIIKPQQKPVNQYSNSEVDRQQVKKELVEFLRSKKEAGGATIQDIKQSPKFQMYSDNILKDILKDWSKKTKRQSRIYYYLPSTLLG